MPQPKTSNPRLQLRADRPDSWIPVEPGDSLRGSLEEVTAAYSDVQAGGPSGDGYYPLLRIKVLEADGYEQGKLLAVHCFAAVLRDRILEQQPIPGEQLEIVYEGIGEQKVRGRNAPSLYRVKVIGRDPKLVAEKAYAGMARRRGTPTQTDTPVQAADFVPPGDDMGGDDIPY
jgi:hypothetical protein